MLTQYCLDCLISEPRSIGLMVDKLIAQLGNQAVSQWITKGGSEQYPPSSLHVSYIDQKCLSLFVIDSDKGEKQLALYLSVGC